MCWSPYPGYGQFYTLLTRCHGGVWGEGHLYGGGTHGDQRVGTDAQTNQVLMARHGDT